MRANENTASGHVTPVLTSDWLQVKSYRAGGEDREDNVLTTCAFSSDKQFVYAGTVLGDVKMFNLSSGEETTYQVTSSTVQYSTVQYST